MSIWRAQFWKSYWIALRRSHRDKRARSFATRVTGILLYFAAYILFFYFLVLRQPEGFWVGIFYAVIFRGGSLVFFLLRRSHRRQNELLNYSFTRDDRAKAPQSDVVVCRYLWERAQIVSTLLARAGSEIRLKRTETPAGATVLARQFLNGRLREHGLWDKLERDEARLVSAPDGNWSEEQQLQATNWCEQLRLPRWTLQIDKEIVPLEHFPRTDVSLAQDFPEQGDSTVLLNPWDLRVEHDIAFAYLVRVIAELKAHGHIAENPELGEWTDEFRMKSLGSSNDYLAGSKTIAELEVDDLRTLGAIASARERYSAYLLEQLTATPIPFSSWSPSP